MRRPAWAGDDSVGQPCHERLACTLIDGAVGFRSAKHHAQTVGFDCLVRQVDPVLAELRCVKLRRHLSGLARFENCCRPLRVPLVQLLGSHLLPQLLGGALRAASDLASGSVIPNTQNADMGFSVDCHPARLSMKPASDNSCAAKIPR